MTTPPDYDPDAAEDCRCTIVRHRTLHEPDEWEQADDCPVHPLALVEIPVVHPNSPLKYARREAARAADEHKLAQLADRLGLAADTAAALERTARDLATLTTAPSEDIARALTRVLREPPAVAFRIRIRGVPYIAEAPIAGSPPGYRLHPDRRQRHLDRAARALRPAVWTAPAGTPPPRPRFLPRVVDAPGCHPAFRLLHLLGGTW